MKLNFIAQLSCKDKKAEKEKKSKTLFVTDNNFDQAKYNLIN